MSITTYALKDYFLRDYFLQALFGLFFFWIIWHCAYKKQGVGFLRYLLIIGPITRILSLSWFFQHMAELSSIERSLFIWTYLSTFILYVWWYKCSLRLITLNENAHKLTSILSYSETQKSSNLEIKKRWLLATIAHFIGMPILTLIMVLSSTSIQTKYVLVYSIALLFARTLMGWSFWHCAYKKIGTDWLTFFLATTPFHVLISISLTFLWGERLGLEVNSLMAWNLTNLIIYVWWGVCSIDLRKINKTSQIQHSICPDYLVSIKSMTLAEGIDDLDKKYSMLVSLWPDLSSISLQIYENSLSKLTISKAVPKKIKDKNHER